MAGQCVPGTYPLAITASGPATYGPGWLMTTSASGTDATAFVR